MEFRPAINREEYRIRRTAYWENHELDFGSEASDLRRAGDGFLTT